MHDHAEQVDAVALALIAPPAQEVRTPLDEWDILQRAAGHSHPGTAGYDIELARFVESAHGITAAQEGLDEGRSQARVPLQQGGYLPLPECDATTVGLGAVWNRHGVRAAIDADRAARGAAQAAPAPVAEDAEDAARYRWLREQCQSTGHLTIAKSNSWELQPWSGDDPDSVIDAARAQAAQPEGGA